MALPTRLGLARKVIGALENRKSLIALFFLQVVHEHSADSPQLCGAFG
jgi:hypothetical protein